MHRAVLLSLAAFVSCFASDFSKDFFAFDNGTGRDQKLPLEEQAAILKRTGYAGMAVFTGTQRIPEVLRALDSQQLRLLSIYVHVHSYVGATEPRIDAGLATAIQQLDGRETMILLTVQGHGPLAEERAVENVRQVADMAAKSGLRVCLYPHINFYIETTADALRIAAKAARSNVGVALNLHHTLAFHIERCGGDDFDPAQLIQAALPRLFLVSINGVQLGANGPGIMRLDQGNYNVRKFVSQLRKAGYRGPIGLQCYRVPGDIEQSLEKSIQAWRAMLGN